MKNFKILLAVFTLTTMSITAFANNLPSYEEDPVKPNEVLRNEIAFLIGDEFPFASEYDTTIQVVFTLNTNNELIVISTDADQNEVDHFLKNKLNYKKVNFQPNKDDKIYLVPIRVSKS